MLIGSLSIRSSAASDRIRQTVALLGRRGYAVSPERLAQVCLGGPISPDEVMWSVAAASDLTLAGGLVVDRSALDRVAEIRSRALGHGTDAAPYLQMTLRFVRALVAFAPFIRSVSIAGSLAIVITTTPLAPPSSSYKSFSVMGKTFDPAKPEDYLASFKIRKVT